MEENYFQETICKNVTHFMLLRTTYLLYKYVKKWRLNTRVELKLIINWPRIISLTQGWLKVANS
jgi:hypothetical protein